MIIVGIILFVTLSVMVMATNFVTQWSYSQGQINHSGAPYQRKVGALFSYV